MNAEVTTIKTAAETALAQALRRRAAGCPATTRSPRSARRAFDLFAKEGLPHRRVEDWKYTDLRALMREAKPLAAPPDAAAKARAKKAGALLGDVETRRLVFVDGAFVAGIVRSGEFGERTRPSARWPRRLPTTTRRSRRISASSRRQATSPLRSTPR